MAYTYQTIHYHIPYQLAQEATSTESERRAAQIIDRHLYGFSEVLSRYALIHLDTGSCGVSFSETVSGELIFSGSGTFFRALINGVYAETDELFTIATGVVKTTNFTGYIYAQLVALRPDKYEAPVRADSWQGGNPTFVIITDDDWTGTPDNSILIAVITADGENNQILSETWGSDATEPSGGLFENGIPSISIPYGEHRTASILDHPDGCVTTDKIADAAVTSGKIATGAIQSSHIWTGAVSADKLAPVLELTQYIDFQGTVRGKAFPTGIRIDYMGMDAQIYNVSGSYSLYGTNYTQIADRQFLSVGQSSNSPMMIGLRWCYTPYYPVSGLQVTGFRVSLAPQIVNSGIEYTGWLLFNYSGIPNGEGGYTTGFWSGAGWSGQFTSSSTVFSDIYFGANELTGFWLSYDEPFYFGITLNYPDGAFQTMWVGDVSYYFVRSG